MNKWMYIGDYIPAYKREVLVYDKENKQYDICYYDEDNKNRGIGNNMKWKNRKCDSVNAEHWCELPRRYTKNNE